MLLNTFVTFCTFSLVFGQKLCNTQCISFTGPSVVDIILFFVLCGMSAEAIADILCVFVRLVSSETFISVSTMSY